MLRGGQRLLLEGGVTAKLACIIKATCAPEHGPQPEPPVYSHVPPFSVSPLHANLFETC